MALTKKKKVNKELVCFILFAITIPILKTKLLNKYANLIGFVNLLPGQDEELYEEYLDEYILKCNPKMLSFDNYPFADGGSFGWYLTSLKLIREKAIEKNLPFGGFVGTSTASYNDKPNNEKNSITAGELNWSVNTLLAYGAKSYTWFTLIQPRSYALVGSEDEITSMDFERVGLIGANGEETNAYGYAQAINQWVANIDHILMESESVALLATGDAATTTGYTTNSDESVEISVDASNEVGAIVGVFHYKEQRAYYVVNISSKEFGCIGKWW